MGLLELSSLVRTGIDLLALRAVEPQLNDHDAKFDFAGAKSVESPATAS